MLCLAASGSSEGPGQSERSRFAVHLGRSTKPLATCRACRRRTKPAEGSLRGALRRGRLCELVELTIDFINESVPPVARDAIQHFLQLDHCFIKYVECVGHRQRRPKAGTDCGQPTLRRRCSVPLAPGSLRAPAVCGESLCLHCKYPHPHRWLGRYHGANTPREAGTTEFLVGRRHLVSTSTFSCKTLAIFPSASLEMTKRATG